MPQNMLIHQIWRLKEEYELILKYVQRFNKDMEIAIKDEELEHLTKSLEILTQSCFSLVKTIQNKHQQNIEKLKDK